MGMLEIPGTLRAGSINMDADATGGGDSIGNKFSQKFSFVDSVPATEGVEGGDVYNYSIAAPGHYFYYAKMTLSGKDSYGIHRTAEIEVFNGELQSLFLSNIDASDIKVRVYGDIIRVNPLFSETWFFTNHVEGYTGVLGGGYNKYYGNRGLWAGGNPPVSDVIDYIYIDSASSSTDFGNLTDARGYTGSCSSGSRGIIAGGTPTAVDTIEFVTVATYGNAVDFGELTLILTGTHGASDGSRGVFCEGNFPPAGISDVLQYITIGTVGDATDFGESSGSHRDSSTSSNGSRGIIAGGFDGSNNVDKINYFTIGTLGGAIDFGELTQARNALGDAASDGNRGLWMGGHTGPSYTDTIDYIAIGTLGDATDFTGELTQSRYGSGSTSNGSRACSGGGRESGGSTTGRMDYVTIGTLGDAIAIGDLSVARQWNTALSGD